MGRSPKTGPADLAYKFHLVRLGIDAGGYDNGGAYWGLGEPLYIAYDDETGAARVELFTRAASRERAREQVAKTYPNARFYR
jgi:hypothetical protein